MYIEVKQKPNGKYEVNPNVTPSGSTPWVDPDMSDPYSDVPIPIGKFVCVVGWNGSESVIDMIEGNGEDTGATLLNTFQQAGAWCYTGSCGNYSFYYPYNG